MDRKELDISVKPLTESQKKKIAETASNSGQMDLTNHLVGNIPFESCDVDHWISNMDKNAKYLSSSENDIEFIELDLKENDIPERVSQLQDAIFGAMGVPRHMIELPEDIDVPRYVEMRRKIGESLYGFDVESALQKLDTLAKTDRLIECYKSMVESKPYPRRLEDYNSDCSGEEKK